MYDSVKNKLSLVSDKDDESMINFGVEEQEEEILELKFSLLDSRRVNIKREIVFFRIKTYIVLQTKTNLIVSKNCMKNLSNRISNSFNKAFAGKY